MNENLSFFERTVETIKNPHKILDTIARFDVPPEDEEEEPEGEDAYV